MNTDYKEKYIKLLGQTMVKFVLIQRERKRERDREKKGGKIILLAFAS